MLALLLASGALLSAARATSSANGTEAQLASARVFLPMIVRSSGPAPAPSPTPTGSLPTSIVSTWFTGTVPPTDFYDPTTGHWRDTSGLGQMYVFRADSSYTYAGFLRLQNGQCRTEVSTYQQGAARASGESLALTPVIAKTRTVVVCGSRSDTTTDGPFDAYTITWRVADDGLGHPKLWLTRGDQTTEYYRQGMVAGLVGGWSLNGVASSGFYDPASGRWATPASDGAWFRFAADGTYQFGEYGHGQDEQGCMITYWVYQEGTARISGGQLAYQATRGRARQENACRPDQPIDQPYVDPKLYEFTWELRDQATAPKLALSPLGQFRYIVFNRE